MIPFLSSPRLSSPLLLAACLLFTGTSALAEKADRDKPVTLDANRASVDDAKKQHIFEGNVVLTQGTLVIHADKLVVTQDQDGFQKGVAYGKPARFKQKREGKDEYVEGEGLRIEHNERTQVTEFFDRAYVKSGQDEVRGQYIQYDGLTEQYYATASGKKGNGPGASSAPTGRVRAIIQPKNGPQAPAPKGRGMTLKPASQLPSETE